MGADVEQDRERAPDGAEPVSGHRDLECDDGAAAAVCNKEGCGFRIVRGLINGR